MNAKTSRLKSLSAFELEREAVTEADIERYLKEHHDEIAGKLQEAEESIARGDVAPLEPLHVLLREARWNAKAKSNR